MLPRTRKMTRLIGATEACQMWSLPIFAVAQLILENLKSKYFPRGWDI